MRGPILVFASIALFGCIEPPPPIQTIERTVALDAQGCPASVEAVDVSTNDKVRWRLDTNSAGYPMVEAFSVAFNAYNPTYCVNDAAVAKAQAVTCTVMVDARAQPVCYAISSRSNGGTQTCTREFVLRVDSTMPHTCEEP